MKSFLSVCATLVVLLTAIGTTAHTRAQSAGQYTVFLPQIQNPGQSPGPNPPSQPDPIPQPGSLPEELVGRWFNGKLLNGQLYDPVNRVWNDAGGLGHTYVFKADGSYQLASYLEIRNGMCVSRVWKYQTGSGRIEGSNLLLTPAVAQTRTVIACGGTSVSETEGPYDTITIPYQVGLDEKGHTILQLSEAQGVTSYYKDGLAPQMLGAWRTGAVSASNFYDVTTGEWAQPEGVGEWYRFNANGTFQHGVVKTEFVDGVCDRAVMTYEEGTLSGSGSLITIKPTGAIQHTVNLCDPSDVSESAVAAGSLEDWAWSLGQSEEGQTLEMLRLLPFGQRILVREE